MEIVYNQGDVIYDRSFNKERSYSIIEQLGAGGSGITYAAKDLSTKQTVAIKVLSLNRLDDWKKIELFEREAKVLKQLNYPGIPQYLDYFQIDTKDDSSFYIVQELARGQSLHTLIEQGWKPNLKTIKRIAEQILDILAYLQKLSPPVIHRDLKPHNIIYQPDTEKLFLVDFGAVQDTYHHTVMGSTVVGTYGYMSPEQFRGGAVLSTDLYSLGCTILFLLTRQSPSELPEQNLKINFRSKIKVKRDFARWLDKLIEPNIRDRFENAEDALKALRGGKAKNKSYIKSNSTSIAVERKNGKLIINIPPVIYHKEHSKNFYKFAAYYLISSFFIVSFSYSLNVFGLIYIVLFFLRIIAFDLLASIIFVFQGVMFFMTAVSMFAVWESIGFLQGLSVFYLLPIVLFFDVLFAPHLQHKLIRSMLFSTFIECNIKGIKIVRNGFVEFKSKHKPTMFEIQQYSEIEYKFLLSTGEPKYQFGGLLTSSEREWLTTEITNYFLSLKSGYYDRE